MILWMLGCAGEETVAPPPAAVPPLAIEGPVWTAPVLAVAAEVPPRFTALLATPTSLESGSPDRYPPMGVVQHGLCTGEGPWRDQLSSSVRALATEERWRFMELTRLSWCRSPDWCGWLGSEAAALGADGAPFWHGLATCEDAATAALVAAKAPDIGLLEWVMQHPGPFEPRLAEIVPRAQTVEARRWVVRALQQTDGAEAEQLLLDLYRRTPPAERDEVATHLGGREGARARELYRAACAGVTHGPCRWRRPDPLRDLGAAIELGVDADALFARYPNHRSALLASFERCVLERASDSPSVAFACARALARADRAAAQDALERVSGMDLDLDLLLQALALPDLAERLRALGFAVPEAPERPEPAALDLLVASGLAVRLDDDESWPPRHDRLLYRLAAAAGLDGAQFDELRPSADAPHIPDRIPRTALFAWLDGVRLRTLVDDETGEGDVVRSVAFVNAALERRGAEGRFAIEHRGRAAVFGPPAALEALAIEGLVRWMTAP